VHTGQNTGKKNTNLRKKKKEREKKGDRGGCREKVVLKPDREVSSKKGGKK